MTEELKLLYALCEALGYEVERVEGLKSQNADGYLGLPSTEITYKLIKKRQQTLRGKQLAILQREGFNQNESL